MKSSLFTCAVSPVICKYLQMCGRIVLTSALACGIWVSASAQNATKEATISPLAQSETRTNARFFQVRNLPPLWMLWRLDSQKPPPFSLEVSRGNGVFLGEWGEIKAVSSALSADVLSKIKIEVIEAQNTLIFNGETPSVETAMRVARELDRPLRQVEIEATILRGDADAMNRLIRPNSPLSFELSPETKTLGDMAREVKVTLATNDWQRQAKEMQAEITRVMPALRVTAINELTAALNTTTTQKAQLRWNEGKTRQEVRMETRLGIAVKPTFGADKSVALTLQCGEDRTLVSTLSRLPLSRSPILKFSVLDGQTVAIIMPDSSIPLSVISQSNSNKRQMNVCLVTTRIIRRLDETVPGT